MKVQKYTLAFYVSCFAIFSLPAFLNPEWFAATLGYELAFQGGLMEFIAAYGGLILGVGIYLAFCLKRNVRAGLVCVLCVVGALFIGRLVGYGVEREISDVQVFFLLIEFITISLISYLLFQGSTTAQAIGH